MSDVLALTMELIARRSVTPEDAGCQEITLDEPSMSCYGYREDPRRFVKIFADTVKPIAGRCPNLP